MDKFAKLYEDDELGQILVLKTTNEEDMPCIQIIFDVDGVQVAVGPAFEDSDEGWDDCDEAFEDTTEEHAVSAVRGVMKSFLGGAL